MFNSLFFFFNDTATTEIYTLSLHDALPICCRQRSSRLTVPRIRYARISATTNWWCSTTGTLIRCRTRVRKSSRRSEEHTSELQSRQYLVCRLLLEKKKKKLYHLFILEKNLI